VYAYTRFASPHVQFLSANPASLSYTSANYADSSSGATSTSGMMLPDFTQAAEMSVNAVVNVRTVTRETSPQSIMDYLFGYQPQQYIVEGIGSGVVISADGYIVTNNHVIEGSNQIRVTMNDKREFDARVIGADPNTDLALLKIDASGLPFLVLGNSDALRVGEWVIAVGNPFNLTSTVTAGIVSAKARDVGIIKERNGRQRQMAPQDYWRYQFRGRQGMGQDPQTSLSLESFIQTDAAINNGNSGGALVNIRGELVGVNTAIASRTGDFSGTSFAIPASLVKKVVSDLIEFGAVQRALLGVGLDEINSDAALKAGVKRTDGVFIAEVYSNSAAEKAQIKNGDVVLAINGIRVNSETAFREQIGRYRPNDEVTVLLVRGDREMTVKARLQSVDGSTEIVRLGDIEKELGAKFAVLSADDKQTLGVRNGVRVEDLRPGKLSSVGVRRGFVITRINDVAVNSAEDISRELGKVAPRGRVVMDGVYQNGQVAYYVFAK